MSFWLYAGGDAKLSISLADFHRPSVTGPIVNIGKKAAVNVLKGVQAIRRLLEFELLRRLVGKIVLDLAEVLIVAQAEPVFKDV